MKKIVFTGGGSAGHVLPNIALIEELQAKGRYELAYMGTDGIEKSIVADYKIPYYAIACPKLVRGGGLSALKNNLQIPFAFFRAVRAAKKGLELLKPDLVFSKGGYVALPVVFACKSLKIPVLLHESDLSPGLANKLSSGKCKYAFTSFPETAKKLRHGKYSGAPIRRAVLTAKKEVARREWDIPKNAKVLLVFGGGSGSKAINESVRKHLKTLTKSYLVLHVCGKGNVLQTTVKNYRQFEFVKDMGGAYALADLVVARAGAGTIFELLALKKPSLLIPLEGATRGDQKENAAYFERRGLCRVLPQSKLDLLPQAIDEAFCDEGLKTRLSECGYGAGNARILGEIHALLDA